MCGFSSVSSESVYEFVGLRSRDVLPTDDEEGQGEEDDEPTHEGEIKLNVCNLIFSLQENRSSPLPENTFLCAHVRHNNKSSSTPLSCFCSPHPNSTTALTGCPFYSAFS